MSQLYTLKTIQKIPADIATVWDFISSPQNLKIITPDYMGFDITTEMETDKMYAGQIIGYKISPMLGLKMTWVTEITHVQDNVYFVDEQRFGPYSFWHHKHFIRPIEGGVEMTDIVHYKIPFGFLGDIAQHLIVKNKLKEIFDYRFRKLEEVFGRFEKAK